MSFPVPLVDPRWLALLATLLIVAQLVYRWRRPVPLPTRTPGLCLLPKFVFSIPLEVPDAEPAPLGVGDSVEERRELALTERMSQFGFVPSGSTPTTLAFTRGSLIGDLSVQLTRIRVVASRPLQDPVEARIEYARALSTLCDTGDLWRFCRDLSGKLVERDRQAQAGRADRAESQNPYQAPLT